MLVRGEVLRPERADLVIVDEVVLLRPLAVADRVVEALLFPSQGQRVPRRVREALQGDARAPQVVLLLVGALKPRLVAQQPRHGLAEVGRLRARERDDHAAHLQLGQGLGDRLEPLTVLERSPTEVNARQRADRRLVGTHAMVGVVGQHQDGLDDCGQRNL